MGVMAVGLALGQAACLQRLAANSTARIMNRASPALQTFSDPALAEAALPYSITQMEGLLLVIPDNTGLRVNLMRALGSFGFGFLEDRMEDAEVADDEGRIEHYRNRATMAYLRGRALGFEQLTREEGGDGGAEGAYRRGVEPWKAYLRRFDDREHAPMVFWLGYNWARHINLNKENPDVLADLPYAVACFERVMQLDPTYNYHSPLVAMASYHARAAESLGGNPAEALRLFDEAIRLTDGRFLTYRVMKARAYAVMIQDRALYTRLLQEVIDAGDVWPEQRLANQLAKRRARRYLAQIDNYFSPAEDGAAAAPAEGGDAAPAAEPAAE